MFMEDRILVTTHLHVLPPVEENLHPDS